MIVKLKKLEDEFREEEHQRGEVVRSILFKVRKDTMRSLGGDLPLRA